MLKILLVLLLFTSPAFAITNQWRGGVGTQELDGTQAAALIGFNTYNHMTQPLDNLLATYCNEYLKYASSSTLTVTSGSCVVSNSGGTIRLFLMDASNSTLTSSNLDTGSLSANTTYYVYATAANNAATNSTYFISANSTAPSGVTYYYKLGTFATDNNTQITAVSNNISFGYSAGTPVSKSANVVYQSFVDGFIEGSVYLPAGHSGNQNSQANFYTSSNSSPSSSPSATATMYNHIDSGQTENVHMPFLFYIRKGDYYEITTSGPDSSSLDAMYFISAGT